MKKSFLSLFAFGVMPLLILYSCGTKYTPLTEEQKKAKADSIYLVKSADEVKAKSDECAKNLDAAVNTKVNEALNAATALNHN